MMWFSAGLTLGPLSRSAHCGGFPSLCTGVRWTVPICRACFLEGSVSEPNIRSTTQLLEAPRTGGFQKEMQNIGLFRPCVPARALYCSWYPMRSDLRTLENRTIIADLAAGTLCTRGQTPPSLFLELARNRMSNGVQRTLLNRSRMVHWMPQPSAPALDLGFLPTEYCTTAHAILVAASIPDDPAESRAETHLMATGLKRMCFDERVPYHGATWPAPYRITLKRVSFAVTTTQVPSTMHPRPYALL